MRGCDVVICSAVSMLIIYDVSLSISHSCGDVADGV